VPGPVNGAAAPTTANPTVPNATSQTVAEVQKSPEPYGGSLLAATPGANAPPAEMPPASEAPGQVGDNTPPVLPAGGSKQP
jgi:hypothetical protein